VLAEFFLPGFRRADFPDGFHLLAAIGFLHELGEEVGRVGEDEVDGGFGDLGEEVEAIALVDAEVVFFVVEGGSGESGGRFGHDDDRSGSLIRWIRESSEEEGRKEAGKKKELSRGERRGAEEETERGKRTERFLRAKSARRGSGLASLGMTRGR
jgi:hypothetical protein